MSSRYKSIAKRLQDAGVLINNISHEDLKLPLEEYSYDEVRINAGRILLNTAIMLADKQKKLHVKQREATRKLQDESKSVENMYLRTLALAKQRVKGEDSEIKDFGVESNTGQSLAAWTTEARLFYELAMEPEKVALMEYFGKTEEKLQGELSRVKAIEALFHAQKDAIGLAQAATQERDKALEALEKWCKDLLLCAESPTLKTHNNWNVWD